MLHCISLWIDTEWSFYSDVPLFLAKISSHSFAHTKAANLLCHVHFVAMRVIEFRLESFIISIQFELWRKLSKMGPWPTPPTLNQALPFLYNKLGAISTHLQQKHNSFNVELSFYYTSMYIQILNGSFMIFAITWDSVNKYMSKWIPISFLFLKTFFLFFSAPKRGAIKT